MELGEPIINIHGDKVALGPLRRDLLPVYLRWMNDFDVIRTLGAPLRPVTLEAETAWYDGIVQDKKHVQFTVYERDGMRPVGGAGLHDINHAHRTAEFGILIGAKDAWNRGFGTETARLVLAYGFGMLGLHNIFLRAFTHNPRGLRAYQKAGFVECGRRREAFRVGPDVFDEVYMDCLATEWEK